MSQADRLHLLSVQFAQAPSAVRQSFVFTQDQQTDLLCELAEREVPLVFVVGHHSLDLFSTSHNHVRAFRPVLSLLSERIVAKESQSAVPAGVARGGDAARYLLRRLVPLQGTSADARDFGRAVQTAVALAKVCGTYDGELSELFQMAERAAERVRAETRLSYADVTRDELELETLDAERIVEEELLSWQTSEPALRASLQPPLSVDSIAPFSSDEPHSMVRLRSANVLHRLGTG